MLTYGWASSRVDEREYANISVLTSSDILGWCWRATDSWIDFSFQIIITCGWSCNSMTSGPWSNRFFITKIKDHWHVGPLRQRAQPHLSLWLFDPCLERWQWVPISGYPTGFTRYKGGYGMNSSPVGMLMGTILYPSGRRVRVRVWTTHTRVPMGNLYPQQSCIEHNKLDPYRYIYSKNWSICLLLCY